MKYDCSLALLCYVKHTSGTHNLIACFISVLVSIQIFYGNAYCRIMILQTLVLTEAIIIITTILAISATIVISIDIFRSFINALSINSD